MRLLRLLAPAAPAPAHGSSRIIDPAGPQLRISPEPPAVQLARPTGAAPFGIRVLIVEPGAFRTEFGGQRMHRSQPIDAYAVSTGATRAAVDSMDGTQPGDPRKAAQAVLEVLDSPEPPLRLALGNDAVDAIAAHHELLRADLTRWEKLSRATDLS